MMEQEEKGGGEGVGGAVCRGAWEPAGPVGVYPGRYCILCIDRAWAG